MYRHEDLANAWSSSAISRADLRQRCVFATVGNHVRTERSTHGTTTAPGRGGRGLSVGENLGDELQDGRVGHAAALAHRLQPVAGAGGLHAVDERRHEP